MADHSPFHSTYPRSGLPMPVQPSYHLSPLSTSGLLSIDNRIMRDERPMATSSSSSSRHHSIHNVSSLLNHQPIPRPIIGLPSPDNSPPLLGVVPSHNPPIEPITARAIASRAGMSRLHSPSGPSPSRQDQEEDDSKGHKKRTRLNSDQGALLKKVWRETCFPSTERRSWLAEQTGLTVRQVQVWFQNQRQKQRNEEYEASKSFSADVPHPLSGPRVAFDGPIAPRDLPERVYNAQGWSSTGPEPGVRRRGSGDRPDTSSSRPMTADAPMGSFDHDRRTREARETMHGWRQPGLLDAEHGLPSTLPPPPLPQPTVWEHAPLNPYSLTNKRQREEYEVVPQERPIKMYRSAAHLSETPDDLQPQSMAPERPTRLPSIRELGLNADAQMKMGVPAFPERGLPGIEGLLGGAGRI